MLGINIWSYRAHFLFLFVCSGHYAMTIVFSSVFLNKFVKKNGFLLIYDIL